MRLRRPLSTALLACAAAFAPMSAHADDCTSFSRCDYNQTQTLIVPMKNRTLSALLEIKDTARARALYERLLPPGYEMPPHPLVGLYVVTIDIPTQSVAPFDQAIRAGNDITHYYEGSLSLRAIHDHKGVKESGWWHLGMPVDSENARTSGLPIGYPKYRAKLRFEQPAAGRWFANATVGGKQTLRLAWHAAAAPVTKELAAFLGEPFYTLAAPLRGPEAWRTRLTALSAVPLTQLSDGHPPEGAGVDNVTKIPEGQPGLVDVAIDPDLNRYDAETPDKMPDLLAGGESLADLVDVEQTAPGLFNDFQQTLLYQMNREDKPFTGGEYWKADAADSSEGSSGPSRRPVCASRRSFSIRLPRTLRSARVRVGRRGAPVIRRRGRLIARVNLRGRRRGRVVVRIAGVTRDGRSWSGRRAYRTCVAKRPQAGG